MKKENPIVTLVKVAVTFTLAVFVLPPFYPITMEGTTDLSHSDVDKELKPLRDLLTVSDDGMEQKVLDCRRHNGDLYVRLAVPAEGEISRWAQAAAETVLQYRADNLGELGTACITLELLHNEPTCNCRFVLYDSEIGDRSPGSHFVRLEAETRELCASELMLVPGLEDICLFDCREIDDLTPFADVKRLAVLWDGEITDEMHETMMDFFRAHDDIDFQLNNARYFQQYPPFAALQECFGEAHKVNSYGFDEETIVAGFNMNADTPVPVQASGILAAAAKGISGETALRGKTVRLSLDLSGSDDWAYLESDDGFRTVKAYFNVEGLRVSELNLLTGVYDLTVTDRMKIDDLVKAAKGWDGLKTVYVDGDYDDAVLDAFQDAFPDVTVNVNA